MKRIYKNINLKLDFPNAFNEIKKEDYQKYGVTEQPNIRLLDALTFNSRAITILELGNELYFFDTLEQVLGEIKTINQTAIDNNQKWQDVNDVNPIYFGYSTAQKNIYVQVLEVKNNPYVLSVNLFFCHKKKIISINTSVENEWKDIETFQNNVIIQILFSVINNAGVL